MSMLFKAKKYLASKFSESQTGQSLILRLFGKQGVAILDALIASASRFFGPDQAKQLKVDILKLITKIVLLYRNAVITAEKAAPARPTLLSMMDCIMDTIEAAPPQRNVKALAQTMQATHDAVMPLLQPNVREHNWQRLTRVFDAYGSDPFLQQFLFEAAYEGEREAVLLNFKALVQPYETEMTEMKKFQRTQQEQRRLKMERMTSAPYSLRLWLEDVHGSVLFQEWLRESEGAGAVHLLLFLRSVDYYRGTNNRGLLGQRAGQVVDAFLSSRATQPVKLADVALRDAVLTAVDAGNHTRGIFDACEADALAQLDTLFTAGFAPASTQFKSLVDEIEALNVRLTRIDKLSIIGVESPSVSSAAAAAEELNVLDMDLKDLGVADSGADEEAGDAAAAAGAGAADEAGGGGSSPAGAEDGRDSGDDTKDLEGM